MITVCVELDIEGKKKSSKEANLNIVPKKIPPRMCVEVVNGTNAHDILKVAADRHPCYNFTVLHTSYGRMIKSICGTEQKPAEKLYWMIHINEKTAPVGIDDLRPQHGSTLRFHYKKMNWG